METISHPFYICIQIIMYDRRSMRASEAILNNIQRSVLREHKNQIDKATAQIISTMVDDLKIELGM